MSNSRDPIKTIAECLLKIPNPFDRQQNRQMYAQCGTLIAFNINLYRCNICGEKLIGEEQILEHHKSLTHAVYIQKESVIKATEPIQCIQSPVLGKGFDSELIAALIELKKDYQRYAQFPGLHPMYAVEMQTFCKQNSTSITTDNYISKMVIFQKKWISQIRDYYDDAVKEIFDKFGVNSKNSRPTFDDVLKDKTGSTKSNDSTSVDSGKSTGYDSDSDSESSSISSNTSESESERDSYGLTSIMRRPLPQQPLDHWPEIPADEKSPANDNAAKINSKEYDKQVHELNVAAMKAVLVMLEKCKTDPRSLTDQQLEKYIVYVIQHTPYKKYLNSAPA